MYQRYSYDTVTLKWQHIYGTVIYEYISVERCITQFCHLEVLLQSVERHLAKVDLRYNCDTWLVCCTKKIGWIPSQKW